MWLFFLIELLMLFMLAELVWRRWRRRNASSYVIGLNINQGDDIFLGTDMAKRFSLATAFIVISLIGLTPAGAQAMVDGAFQLISTDDNVLQVTNLEDGTFKVEFVGAGEAKLVASVDADLSDGVRQIYQEFPFLVYDQSDEADHIDLLILDTVPRAAADDAGGGDKVAAGGDAAADAASEAVDDPAIDTLA